MSELNRGDFADFFAEVNKGHRPFEWQERLLDSLLTQGRWPDQIAAPTGAGKTSVIDVHVFASALADEDGAVPRLPRRLVMVSPRRVLVDDQHQRAVALLEMLSDDASGPVSRQVSAALRRLNRLETAAETVDADSTPARASLIVGRLRGGEIPSRLWRERPNAVSVLCATPDMIGSRLLFNGYGTAGYARPREAGLLAYDTVVIVDEAHLCRQFMLTTRRVGELAAICPEPIQGIPLLQTVETSATPTGRATAQIGVEEGDLTSGGTLADRLTRPKPLSLVSTPKWPDAKAGKALVDVIVEEVARLVDGLIESHGTAGTVGCFVNSVPMAVAVDAALRKGAAGRSWNSVMICGRLRPADLQEVAKKYPGLLTIGGSPSVDVLVSTQSLEVGVDLDLSGMVTELAPGTALAQRTGRVNRLGRRPDGPVSVIVPQDEELRIGSGPYGPKDLTASLRWLRKLECSPEGLSPWALRQHRPPEMEPQRPAFQRLELAQAWHLARTSEDLAAAPELDLWLRDSFDSDDGVGIVVRDRLPLDPAELVELLIELPPQPHEVFPVSMGTARAVMQELTEAQAASNDPVACATIRGEQVTSFTIDDLHPGDVLVVDSRAAICLGGEGVSGFTPPVVVARRAADLEASIDVVFKDSERVPAPDVLHRIDVPATGQVVLRLERDSSAGTGAGGVSGIALPISAQEALDSLFELDGTERQLRSALAEVLAGLPANCVSPSAQAMVTATERLLKGYVRDSQITWLTDLDDQWARVIIRDQRRAMLDEELRQVVNTGNDREVLLNDHGQAVQARAREIAASVGLDPALCDVVGRAGLFHDEGKRDKRFQRDVLGNVDPGRPWAKSRSRKSGDQIEQHRLTRQAKQSLPTTLPRGWRHEQLSVLQLLANTQGRLDEHTLLTVRLVGASHGRGRNSFQHNAEQLLVEDSPNELRQLAREWFDHGVWERTLERTTAEVGVWGCAYLEALVRAADGQVSGEGR